MTRLEEERRHQAEDVALEDETHDNPRATGSGDHTALIQWVADQQGVETEDLILNV